MSMPTSRLLTLSIVTRKQRRWLSETKGLETMVDGGRCRQALSGATLLSVWTPSDKILSVCATSTSFDELLVRMQPWRDLNVNTITTEYSLKQKMLLKKRENTLVKYWPNIFAWVKAWNLIKYVEVKSKNYYFCHSFLSFLENVKVCGLIKSTSERFNN